MKTFFTICAIIFLSTGLFAQKFIQEWWEPLPNVPGHSEAKAIMTTDDNKLLIAGPTHETWDKGNMFYAKTDSAGNIIWLTYADEQFESYFQRPYHLMTDIDGNLDMIGTYPVVYSSGTYFSKISPSGEILNSTMNGGQYDYQGGYDMEQTADSGFLVAAFKEVYGPGNCFALRKLDNTGHFIWDTTFVDADSNFIGGEFHAMDIVDDSTFVLTGKRDYEAGSAEDLDIIFAKVRVYDDSVKLINLTIYEGEYNDYGTDILTLPDEQGYIICGSGPNENSPSYSQGIILRVDTAGNILWRKTYSRSINSYTSFISEHLDANNDIIVLAQTNGGSIDATLLKYSLEGNMLQKKHFDNGNNNEPTYDFTIDQDGKIYILATTFHDYEIWASVLKVKDICPVDNPDASIENDQPVLGDDIVVHVDNTKDVWQYSLVLLKDSIVLGTYMGNNGTLDFTAAGLNNEDISEGVVVSVIEPNVDCYKNSDTLYPEFICPVETPEASLVNPTPNMGDDLVVRVLNTNTNWEYKLTQINGEVMLGKSMGNGGTYEFTVPGLTNEDVSDGLVVSAMLPGFEECMEYSDTLYPEFIDGIEDIYRFTLRIVPNPGHDFVTVSDTEHRLSELTVYNMNGQAVIKRISLSGNDRIDISVLPEGLYFFRVTYRDGMSVYRKVLKN